MPTSLIFLYYVLIPLYKVFVVLSITKDCLNAMMEKSHKVKFGHPCCRTGNSVVVIFYFM